MSPSQSGVDGSGLFELPTEVRHAIYRYLFCHEPPPIWIGTRYHGLPPNEAPAPIFQTSVFRVCKKLHRDAVTFAYSANEFELRDWFPAFCGLGPLALSSIQSLVVSHGIWLSETEPENRAWKVIRHQCTGLKHLEVDLHADMLFPAIPFLSDFFASLPDSQKSPVVRLDLYVWDRHFSFDPVNRDYSRTRMFLSGKIPQSPNTPKFTDPRTRMMRLPSQADDIVFTADVTIGAINALDDYLASSGKTLFVKSAQQLPEDGRRAAGRTHRYWYSWDC